MHHAHGGGDPARQRQDRLQALTAVTTLGTTWIRSGFGMGWSTVEASPGTWNFSAGNALLATLQSDHLQLLAELVGVPAWTPHAYAEVVARAAQAIHAADPQAIVMGGGFWFAGPRVEQFQQAIFTDPHYPLGKYVDVFNLHMTQTTVQATRNWLQKAHDFLNQYGSSLPLWVDEFAYSSNPATQVDPALSDGAPSQAAYVQQVLALLAGDTDVRGIFYTSMVDDPSALHPIERDLGLMHADFTPKPAYTAYQQFIAADSGGA